MTDYYNGDMQIVVNGKEMCIPAEVIKEIHRQENIQWGKNILENYTESIGKDLDTITDDEFEAYSIALEDDIMCDNGDIEWNVMERMFGVIEE